LVSVLTMSMSYPFGYQYSEFKYRTVGSVMLTSTLIFA
jgi:hypothetical protein